MGTEAENAKTAELLAAHQGLVNDEQQTTEPPAEAVVDNGNLPAVEEVTPNPAWEELMASIPEEMHKLVEPHLKKWDQGVQEKMRELHTQYDPYKEIAKNKIPVEDINNSLVLMRELQTNPEEVIKDAIEAFGLDFVAKELAATQTAPETPTEPDPFAEAGLDITQHPAFKEVLAKLDKVSTSLESDAEAKANERAIAEHEKELDALAETHGEFDKNFVTTLMVSGLDGATAVKQYQDAVNQAAAKLATTSKVAPTAPVVIGEGGNTGSGIPNEAIDLVKLSRKDTNDLAMQIVEKYRDS